MRRPIGSFWPAGHSQIYPEPARLEAARFLRHRVVDRPGRRETKRYTITEAGRKALREWIIEPTPQASSRDEFLLKVYSLWLIEPVKVYSLWLIEPARAASLVRDKPEEHGANLREYERRQRAAEAEHSAELRDPATRNSAPTRHSGAESPTSATSLPGVSGSSSPCRLVAERRSPRRCRAGTASRNQGARCYVRCSSVPA